MRCVLVANKLGEENKADLVVWGWYVAAGQGINVTYHVTTIQHDFGLGYNGISDKPINLNAEKERVDSFDFQSKELADNLVNDTLSGISGVLNDKQIWNKSLTITNLSIEHLENNPDSFKEFKLDMSSRISLRAVLYYLMGEVNKSITEANNAINIYPSHEALVNRSMILSLTGNIESAKEGLYKAIELDPTKAVPYLNLGSISIDEGDYEQGIEIINKGIDNIGVCTIENSCHYLYFYRGRINIILGNMDEAKNDFEIVKNLIQDPEFTNYLDSFFEATP